MTLLLVSISWTLLSREFVYGQGHTERPIIEYLLLYLVAWGAFVFGFFDLVRRKEGPSLSTILTVAVLARLMLLPSGLIQENDVYRYVLDGQVILSGENPFEYSPLVLPEMASENLSPNLELPEAQKVLLRVGYPEVPTIYPPVAQLAFAAGGYLSGWNWMGQRIIFLAVDLLLIIALILVLKSFAFSTSWVMIYAWNPLVLKEITNSAHLDVLVAFFLVVVLLALFKCERTPSFLWVSVPAAALAFAILSKFYPLLLIPACLLFLRRIGAGMVRISQFCAVVAVVVVLGYVPFLTVDPARLISGLAVYAQQWRMNDGFFSILEALFPNPRLVGSSIIAVMAISIPFFRSNRTVADLATCFQWILLIWYLTIPTPYPWYAVPLVALAATRPNGAATLVVIVLSGVTCLYYLSFYYEYHNYPADWWFWTRALEHSFVWLTMFLTWRFWRGGVCEASHPI
jgi:hypothetical protein